MGKTAAMGCQSRGGRGSGRLAIVAAVELYDRRCDAG